MRFVHDHKAVVECAPAHEGNWSNLNDVLLEEPIYLFLIEQIIERIIKWPQIRVDLLLQCSGEKPESLTCLNGGACEDNAIHLFVHQRRDSHGDRKIGLTCASRTDSEDHIVFFDRFDITPLIQTLRLNHAFSKRTLFSRFRQTAQRGIRIGGDNA